MAYGTGFAAIPAEAIAGAVGAARGFLRMDGAGEQELLERLAASAILIGEAFTGTVFIARESVETIAADGEWRMLDAAPVTAITDLSGLGADGAALGEGAIPITSWSVDIDPNGLGWVRVTQAGDAVRAAVTCAAGIAATWDDLPAPLAQGVTALVAHLFADRSGREQPPASVSALWRPWRRMRIGRLEHAA